MAWIESHQSLGRHPKLKAAARELGISRVQMVGHLQYLWWWALDYAEDGDLSQVWINDIAEEAMWDEDPQEFVNALVSAGFLTSELHIKDWADYTGRLVQQRESNRQRQRRFREKKRDVTASEESDQRDVTDATARDVTASDDASECDVTVTSRLGNGATVPNQTKPNQTQGEDSPKPPQAAEPQPEQAKPRTEKQQASDAAFERRLALYGAWCEGVGIDPEGEEARVGRDIAFRHLKPIVSETVPTPEEFGACTRYLASQSWRDDPPSIPQVIQGYGRWVGQGRPKRASPRTAPTGRASPARRGGMTPEEIAAYALELEAQGR